jgi:hypothetical protein
MSAFSIDIESNKIEVSDDLVLPGSIRIGELKEGFHASLSYWSRADYISQWKVALDRLLRGEKRSALITSMYDPQTANFVFWWVMYLIEDLVHIQNHVLFLSDLNEPFDEDDIYASIPERETRTEEGESISEWTVELSAIRDFCDAQ